MKEAMDELCVNTIRTLAIDAVQQANSGHPGTPMALAPVAYCLWQRFLRFDPSHPIWPNRDRFVLSIGHASMLLYSLLHLTGVKAVNPKYEVLGELAVPWTTSSAFGSSTANAPATRNTVGPLASRRPRAHWAKGSPLVSGWPLPGAGWVATSIAPDSTCLTMTFMPSAATAA
jgi:hypothetical protein